MDILNDVKLALGIAQAVNSFNTDLDGLICACKADLKLCGISESKINDDDALVNRAIIFYCKAYFRNSDSSERYRKAYEALRTAMSMAGEYRNV